MTGQVREKASYCNQIIKPNSGTSPPPLAPAFILSVTLRNLVSCVCLTSEPIGSYHLVSEPFESPGVLPPYLSRESCEEI